MQLIFVSLGPAYSAEAKGYTVAVFEKESYVGGKTKTVEVDGAMRPYFMGAALHVSQVGSSLMDLFQKFRVKELALDYRITYFNKDGSSAKFLPPLPVVQFAVQAMKLVFLRASLAKYINGPEGYLSDYPASLNEPVKASQLWCCRNHYMFAC